MRITSKPVLLCVAGALCAATAPAATVYDTTLASPNTNPATPASPNPSFYLGTSNPQGGFTVVDSNGIELGIRAKYRQGIVIDSPNNYYYLLPGNQDASHALWNYEYSIDLEPDGIGSLTFNDVSVSLSITDLTTLATKTVDPLNGDGFVTDNVGFGTTAGKTLANRDIQVATDWSAQNSENPEFPNFLPNFNSASTDLYEFVLQVTRNSDSTVLATDVMFVEVTTEPSTLILLSTGCLGFFLFAVTTPPLRDDISEITLCPNG